MDDLAARVLRRLVRRYRSGVWVGAIRRVFGPVAEVHTTGQGEQIDSHPPHYLSALWKPLRPEQPFLRRWPHHVSLVATSAQHALDEMLRHVPVGQRLWLTHETLDWAVMAEIVMIGEAGLAPWQLRELQAFVDAERLAVRAEIRAGYGGAEAHPPSIPQDFPGLPR